jgi:hypothetical protein
MGDSHGQKTLTAYLDRIVTERGKADSGFCGALGRTHALIEDVPETLSEFFDVLRGDMGRQVRALPRGEYPKIIYSVHMVRMNMGEPDFVDLIDPAFHELEPQFRRGVDEEAGSTIGLEDGSVPGTSVAGIIGGARLARTPDDGHPE